MNNSYISMLGRRAARNIIKKYNFQADGYVPGVKKINEITKLCSDILNSRQRDVVSGRVDDFESQINEYKKECTMALRDSGKTSAMTATELYSFLDKVFILAHRFDGIEPSDNTKKLSEALSRERANVWSHVSHPGIEGKNGTAKQNTSRDMGGADK